MKQFASTPQAKVATTIENNRWKWPEGRRHINAVNEIIQALPPDDHLGSSCPDSIRWLADSLGVFTLKSAMRLLVPEEHTISWHQLVWFKHSIPRHSFVLWMLCLNRLNTKDRLVKWGVISDPWCPLCTTAYESCEHLFFQCNYAAYVWSIIQESLLMYRGAKGC